MRRLLGFLLFLLILAAGYMYVALYLPYQGFPSGGVYVDIPHGASQRTIARMLSNNGVVRSRLAFEALCRSRKRRTLEAGEYFFDHPVTSFEVFDTLANGRVYVKELVVPEGFTMFDIADLAASEGFLSRDDFAGEDELHRVLRVVDELRNLLDVTEDRYALVGGECCANPIVAASKAQTNAASVR